MSEMIERIALVIATFSSDAAMKHNLAEIDQADQFSSYRAAFPVKVTECDRELAKVAIEAMRELPSDPGPRYDAGEYSRRTQEAMVEDALR